MARGMTEAERKAAFLELAEAQWKELEAWYAGHPEATFEEIEGEARLRRRELMGEALGLLINGQSTGQAAQAPQCETCANALQLKGYRTRLVRGLEGDTRLERAYYVCAACKGQTLFPPGPTIGPAR